VFTAQLRYRDRLRTKKKGEHPPLEDGTRTLVKKQQADKKL
jgi:hypothetical protein